jgi:hypothetical protein
MPFFIKPVPESEASGKLREFYDKDISDLGIPSNTTRAFSLFPETWEAFRGMIGSIRKHIRLRDYELTTFAAAMEMGCTF